MSGTPLPVTVVSGLPRSGTSLMMQLLDAGGLPLLTDGVRVPDVDNPRGYFEYEPVKELQRGCDWIEAARGRCVKVLWPRLSKLPRGLPYQILLMRRPIDEVLASQRAMLERKGRDLSGDHDAALAASFERECARVKNWIGAQRNFRVLELDYPALVASPRAGADAVVRFLGRELDAARMVAAVEPALYRQRSSLERAVRS